MRAVSFVIDFPSNGIIVKESSGIVFNVSAYLVGENITLGGRRTEPFPFCNSTNNRLNMVGLPSSGSIELVTAVIAALVLFLCVLKALLSLFLFCSLLWQEEKIGKRIVWICLSFQVWHGSFSSLP